MSNYWFTSDLHLGHANVLKYCGRTIFMTKEERKLYDFYLYQPKEEQRKFKISQESLDRMNEGLINKWNERIKPEDTIFHIGDFCFKNSSSKRGEGIKVSAIEWEKRLNGKIIHIKGNHDKNNSTKTIIHRLVISHANKQINLVHNPEHVDSNYEINFVGHIHQNWKIKRIRQGWKFTDAINVGTDVWNYYPVNFNELMGRYYNWKKGMKI